jgi:pimeloyl-ACP methyl ester carboxylesterase
MSADLHAAAPLRVEHLTVHGHDRAYVMAGEGPPLVLLHGVGSNLRTWDRVIERLSRDHLVIAPDMLGHGESSKPRADYSLGGFANGLRDLISILGVERATVVGHSFGGGVAMQFAYQFPERTERVVLVGSGGLGRQVNPLLRAMTLPGAGPALTLAEITPVRALATRSARILARLPLLQGRGLDVDELTTAMDDLASPAARWAFLHVLRAAVDPFGQVVTMLDRCYLAAAMPVMLVWGDQDRVIPVDHAWAGLTAMPGSRLEVFQGAGHFPHRDDPGRFVAVLRNFVRTTTPAAYDPDSWRAMLRGELSAVGQQPSLAAVSDAVVSEGAPA